VIWKLLSVPRFRVIKRPSPLEELSVLGRELGIRLFIKRDDLLEIALGGNKIRKLEFIFGDIVSKGYDTVITTGAYHSNHARLTAAFARKSGVDVYLVLTKPGSKDLKGNLLLDKLLGAKILHADNPDEADKIMNELAQELEKRGRKPYVISRGGAIPPGVLGYAYAVFELAEQFSELNVKPNYIIHASGTGATQAGLILGSKLAGLDAKIIGISVGRRSPELINRIYRLVEEGARYAGAEIRFTIDDVIVYDDYTEGGYGVISERVVNIIREVSLKETIFLDPVYTAKAVLGLIDLVERGVISRGSNVLFIHTGGTPIIFQYDNEIANYLRLEE